MTTRLRYCRGTSPFEIHALFVETFAKIKLKWRKFWFLMIVLHTRFLCLKHLFKERILFEEYTYQPIYNLPINRTPISNPDFQDLQFEPCSSDRHVGVMLKVDTKSVISPVQLLTTVVEYCFCVMSQMFDVPYQSQTLGWIDKESTRETSRWWRAETASLRSENKGREMML